MLATFAFFLKKKKIKDPISLLLQKTTLNKVRVDLAANGYKVGLHSKYLLFKFS